LRICELGGGVVGVDQAPVLYGGAVVLEWVKFLEGGAIGEVKPLAFAAVQILKWED
jgi:hypothetical protein